MRPEKPRRELSGKARSDTALREKPHDINGKERMIGQREERQRRWEAAKRIGGDG